MKYINRGDRKISHIDWYHCSLLPHVLGQYNFARLVFRKPLCNVALRTLDTTLTDEPLHRVCKSCLKVSNKL